MDPFKERLIAHCRATLRRKIELVAFTMEELKASMENETKSSAGDKHETARARMQGELEKLGWQMEELKSQFMQMDRIDPERTTDLIVHQNLVHTDRGLFFIMVPLGKLDFEEKTVYVISPDSPIGKKMMGVKVNGSFELNTIRYTVLSIF